MTKINLKQLFDLPYCRGSYQVRDSYCALGKGLVALTGETDLGITSIDNEILHFEKDNVTRALRFISEHIKLSDISTLNDSNKGDPKLNHEQALKLLITKGLECGIFVLDEESKALSKEFLSINKENEVCQPV